jgi:hypothetical protein
MTRFSCHLILSKGNTMKSLLAIVASVFALSAVAQAPAKKEEAKPAAAAPAKKDEKKAEAPKADAKKDEKKDAKK